MEHSCRLPVIRMNNQTVGCEAACCYPALAIFRHGASAILRHVTAEGPERRAIVRVDADRQY